MQSVGSDPTDLVSIVTNNAGGGETVTRAKISESPHKYHIVRQSNKRRGEGESPSDLFQEDKDQAAVR